MGLFSFDNNLLEKFSDSNEENDENIDFDKDEYDDEYDYFYTLN